MKVQRLRRTIAIASIAMAAAANAAATTWRCGNTYTDQPCADGQALPMDAAPSTERVRDADAQTRKTQATAARMEAERLRRDRERPGVVHLPGPAASARTPVESTPAVGRKNNKAHKTPKARPAPDVFTAAGPGSAKAPQKKKAAKAQPAG
jgi:hypothetical protein